MFSLATINRMNARFKAHVMDASAPVSLCGKPAFQVRVKVDAKHAHKEHNNTCKACLKKLQSDR